MEKGHEEHEEHEEHQKHRSALRALKNAVMQFSNPNDNIGPGHSCFLTSYFSKI